MGTKANTHATTSFLFFVALQVSKQLVYFDDLWMGIGFQLTDLQEKRLTI